MPYQPRTPEEHNDELLQAINEVTEGFEKGYISEDERDKAVEDLVNEFEDED